MSRQPQHIRITQYIRDTYDVSPEHLWKKYPDFAVFRHPHSGKWFGLLMNLGPSTLGMRGDENIYVLNVHCAPAMLATVLPDDAFLPGYHMNKNSWSTIILDDRLTDKQIYPILEASYFSVAPAVKKKK